MDNVDNPIQRAILTGATGMIGMALMEYLLKQGTEVIALVRRNSPKLAQLPKHKNLSIVEADLSELCDTECIAGKIQHGWNGEDLKEKGKSAFFHLGWEGTFGESRNDMYLQNKNIRYTLDAVHLAHALFCEVFVGAGSQAEYGRCDLERKGNEVHRDAKRVKLAPHTPVFPENGYGMAKLAAGQMSRILCKEKGIRHVWGRILSVYGPYDGERTMVMSAILTLLQGKRPAFSKGEQLWDYLYAEDAARALYQMAAHGRDGAVYPIGSGQERPLLEYICRIRDSVNPSAEIGIGEIPYMPMQVMYLCADISELTKDTGFLPEISFEEGIRRTVEWIRCALGMH